jgi:predicted lipoprotein with Yx(FWY)xxD motif
MTRTSPIKFLSGAAVLPLVALAVAGCGGGSDSTASAESISTHGSATVDVANTSLGKILVDSKGRTLYLFRKDKGAKSSCFGACATNWPPLRTTRKPTVSSGVTASKAATTKRSDGKPEVTYNGHPLYLFAGDQKAGDTNGQGVNAFGGSWFAVSPAGTQVSGSANSGSSTSSGGSGY